MKKTKNEILDKINAICEKRNFKLAKTNLEKFAENSVDLFKEETNDDEQFAEIEKHLETINHFVSGNSAKLAAEFAKKEEELKKSNLIPKKDEIIDIEEKGKGNEDLKNMLESMLKPYVDKITELDSKLSLTEKTKTAEQLRNSLLESAKTKWGDQVANISVRNFDFSQEKAESEFEETLKSNAEILGRMPNEPNKNIIDTTTDFSDLIALKEAEKKHREEQK